MNHNYYDIRRRIATKPLWWDERAVPRYCRFSPRQIADIYADECCLLVIACQNCGRRFRVAMSRGLSQYARNVCKLSDLVKSNQVHYGDPPNVDCCASGPTMNSIPLRVMQFWRRGDTWVRYPELERKIACDWAKSCES